MTKEEYQKYLQSDHWRALRNLKLEQSGKECKICGSNKEIEVHHLQYHNLYDVCLGDLQVLCRYCHTLYHKFKKNKSKKMRKKFNFLSQNRIEEIKRQKGLCLGKNKRNKIQKSQFKLETRKLANIRNPYRPNYRVPIYY